MLTLEEKIGQMLMIGFHGLQPPDYVLEWLRAGRIGGVILFARNVASPAQVAELTQACHEAARHPLLISIDQEGGIVARLRANQGFTESPGAMVLGVSGSEMLAEQTAAVLAHEMRALGINWNLAPVVDLTHDIRNPSTGTRSVGADKKLVSRLVTAQVRGFQNAGVAASAKHFPGLGNTPIDTHEAKAVIDDPEEFLWENDMVPFRVAVKEGVASVMVSHVNFNAIDPEYPATLSPRVIQGLLRDEIGFEGVVCTDCLEMRAISDHYTPSESAILSALAGEDLILFSHTFNPDHLAYSRAYDDLLGAVKSGRVPLELVDAANVRIQAMKTHYQITAPADLSVIRHPNHVRIMRDAARAGLVMLRNDGGLIPLKTDAAGTAVIEFASVLDTAAMETNNGWTNLGGILKERAPGLNILSIKAGDQSEAVRDQALQMAQEAETVVLATRSAHLNPAQLEMAHAISEQARKLILLCLRNPYDVNMLRGQAILCTCGDSTPSLEAAVDALLGAFTPAGHLTVPVELRN